MYADELTLQPDARMFHLACPAGVLDTAGPRSERRILRVERCAAQATARDEGTVALHTDRCSYVCQGLG